MFSSLAACPDGSALGDLFDYEDGGHVVFVTNLKENACNLNTKIADFQRTNMLALPSISRRCRQLEGGGHVTVVANLKEKVMCQQHGEGYAPSLPTSTRMSCDSLKT